jgi:hypothetical protein
MLFINISSDKVQIADAKRNKFLDRNSIESTLGATLNERYKTSSFTDIFLLNGPGGFTNLRVGTLTLNLLNKLLWSATDSSATPVPRTALALETSGFRIFSLTKLDLFSYLYKKWFLSSSGVVYIGQRDNVRLYDAEKKSYEQIKLDTIEKNTNLFFDYVNAEYRGEHTPNMLHFHMTETWLEIMRKEKTITITPQDLWLEAQAQVKPEYMIEAVV